MQTPTTHRQGFGDLYAIPAEQVQVNDYLIWNQSPGMRPITQISDLSPAFLQFTEEHRGLTAPRHRKIKRTTPVVVHELHNIYVKAKNDTLRMLNTNIQSTAPVHFIASRIDTFTDWLNFDTTMTREARADTFGKLDAYRDYLKDYLNRITR